MSSEAKETGTPLNLIIIFCFLTFLIIISGFYFYRNQLGKNESDIFSHLTYISKLKADQITSWRSERMVDAIDIQANQSLINDIRDWLLNNNNSMAKSRIQNWIQYLSSNVDINYDRVTLLNLNFKVELSSGSNQIIESWEKQSLEEALKSKQIQFTDLHHSSHQIPIGMDLIIPLLYPDNKNGELISFLLVSIDPRKALFPLIKTWPAESKSAETLIIRPDGDSVLFLNDLRGKSNTALNFKLPLSMIEVPSVQAVLGYRGIFEGRDYRGVRVMSYIKGIPGTNWVMITKVDLDETLEPLRKTTLLIVSFGIIIILIVGITLIYIWKNQQSKFYKEKFNLETESKKALRESEVKFRYLAESITDIFFAVDKDFKLTYWNKASEKMSGIQAKDALGKSIYDIFPNVKGNKTEKVYLEVLRTKLPKTFINEFQSEGKSFAFEVSVYSSPDGLSVFTKDISEQRRVEEAIRESEERYRSLFENMIGGFAFCRMIYENDQPSDFIHLQVNNAFGKMTGLKNVIGKNITELIPGVKETNPELFEIYGMVARTGKMERFETYMPAFKGWFAISVYSPATEFFITIFEDITERKIADKTIKASLKEKEVLLRELYHRTKNNMQVISSLMGLKAASINDKQMIDILDEMKNRIQTIALVHQKLYQSQNLSKVDLKEYITDLVYLLAASYSAEKDRITFNLNLEAINVLIDTAVPCGLIINELISNSFKHAFPEGRKGNICVQLTKLNGDSIELKISDNGIGISNVYDLMQKNTLGMQLFHNIAIEQLMGEIKIESKNGLAFTITFQDIAYQERV
ncbi:MAG: histidine kinase dimerization/phosphoacceptor domain -containing protein [Ignavibacteriaceae bacterium]|nr:histidine kinase dimerization/phosphoacceptor domain -containing protein [Ignavibacteriaceae bacterium]